MSQLVDVDEGLGGLSLFGGVALEDVARIVRVGVIVAIVWPLEDAPEGCVFVARVVCEGPGGKSWVQRYRGGGTRASLLHRDRDVFSGRHAESIVG